MSLVNYRTALIGTLPFAVVALASCGQDPDTLCTSTVSSAQVASPSVGVVTAPGSFTANETVTLRYSLGGTDHDVTGSVSNDRKVMTFTGVPAGSQLLKFYVNCSVAGTYELSESTVAVK